MANRSSTSQADSHRPLPELTVYVARAAFPDGNPYLSLRDALGTFSDDERFVALLPNWGRHAEARWRLAE